MANVLWNLVNAQNFDPVGSAARGYQAGTQIQNDMQRRSVLAELAGMGPNADLAQASMRLLPYDPQTAGTLANLGMAREDRIDRRQNRATDVAWREAESQRAQRNADRSYGLQAAALNPRLENTPENRAQRAAQFGLDPNSPEGRGYILTGNLAPHRQARVPVGIQNAEAEDIGAVQSLGTINSELARFDNLIASGKLNLSGIGNLMAQGRNFVGASDESSRNYASFSAALEKMRNDSLRLNKGVQTEGDSQRAWNELVANINDPKVVRQRLAEIQRLNTIAANFKRNMITQRREDNNLSPLDVDKLITAPQPHGAGPRAGDVDSGFRFKGGDPADPNSWERVAQ
jgi:hypothetical protein